MSTAAVMLIVVLLILMFSGVPITWSLGAACVASICLDPTLSFSVLCQKIFTGCDNFSMLSSLPAILWPRVVCPNALLPLPTLL